MFTPRLLLASILVTCCLTTSVFGATLPDDEVQYLRDIAKTLGKTNWNFSVDPCSGEEGWATANPVKGFENAVTCNCSFSNATVCHVVSIVLKAQNLPGALPKELVKFPYLQEIDLSRNFINGTIPAEWGSMQLVNISLLGNRLSGSIPKELGNITTLTSISAEFNQLSGALPQELGKLPKIQRIDLSYNNFTAGSQGTLTCQQRSVNLFASTSRGNTSGTVYCLRSFQCPKSWYSLLINCGGRQVTLGGNTTYEEDTDGSGPSRFFQSRSNWAFSSTGHFLDDDRPTDTYIGTNASKLSMNDSQLYMNARISPISLTYYGFCLGNGNYTVNLHFAEIMFTNDNTYSSLGRRIFDIYLQVLTLKEQGSLLDLVDPRMGSDYNKEEVMAMINVALLCTNATAAARPAMSSVVSMLEGRAAVQELVTDSSNFSDESKSQAMKRLYQHLEEKSAPESQRHSSMSTVGPWTSSSTSAADLYPVTLTSDYWQNRDSSTT
ncbi:hypothetical protein QUC31_002312 [Theobroma cacao]